MKCKLRLNRWWKCLLSIKFANWLRKTLSHPNEDGFYHCNSFNVFFCVQLIHDVVGYLETMRVSATTFNFQNETNEKLPLRMKALDYNQLAWSMNIFLSMINFKLNFIQKRLAAKKKSTQRFTHWIYFDLTGI